MLSLIIGPDGIKMDPKKVEAITAWPIPTKVKEVQSFLGLPTSTDVLLTISLKSLNLFTSWLARIRNGNGRINANYGWHPRMGIEPWRAGKSEPAKKFAECMKEIPEEASTALSKAWDDMTYYADQHRGSAPEDKVGNNVWLSMKNIKINQPSWKLAEQQLRPFEIIKVISPNAVKLKLLESFKIHDIINVSQARLYKPPVAEQHVTPPEAIEVEGSPEYKVEEVLNSWLKRQTGILGEIVWLHWWS